LTESETGFILSIHRTCRSGSTVGRLARAGPRCEGDYGRPAKPLLWAEPGN